MKIRYHFVNHKVLTVYSMLEKITFPINVKEIISLFDNIKYVSYADFAQMTGVSIDEVSKACESKDGCSIYERSKCRYLIICNESTSNNNNLGRQRWTAAHELGHILCEHHINNMLNKEQKEFEADYFAAMLLSPFPLFEQLGINSPESVKNMFGLSLQAANNRYIQYSKWRNSRVKTAWENDLIRIFNHPMCV